MVIAAVGAAAAVASAASGIASAASGGGSQSGAISGGAASANAAQEQALANFTTNEQPYIDTGTGALGGAADAAGLNGPSGSANALGSFQASPGYQYQLQQGLSAIDNGAASTSTLRSGNTIRAEEGLGEQLANQDFSAYYNRLAGLAGQGQTATAVLGSAGVSTAAGQAGTDTSAAAAQAGIAGGQAKAIGGAVNGLLNNSSVQNALGGVGTPATTQAPVTTSNALSSLGDAGSFNLNVPVG